MKLLYVLIFLLLPIVAIGQISLGIIGGANIGSFGGIEPPDASYASRTGLNIGMLCTYRFNEDISLTLQPMYSQRGSNIDVGEDTFRDSLQTYEVPIDYLVIPLFIRVDSDNGVTYFISGLEFGLPLSAELTHEGTSKDISELLNTIDILASIGMGLRFSIGKPDLLVEFRYYQGLVDLNSDSGNEDGKVIFEDLKSSGFQLMVGLEWKL